MARNFNNPIINSGVWSTGILYPKHSPVYTSYTGDAYYCTQTHTSTGSNDLQNHAQWTRAFLWKPSANSSFENEPRNTYVQFGDGYSQRFEDGINTQLINLSLSFNKRSQDESVGILHFLHEFGGIIPFSMTPPSPYSQTGKLFVSQQWQGSYNFKNNNTISAKFLEVGDRR